MSPREFWLTLGSAICSGALVPVAAWIAKCIVDLLATGEPVGPALWWLLGIEAGVLLVSHITEDISNYANALLRERGRHMLRLQIFERVSELDLADLEQPEHHDSIAKAANEAVFRPAILAMEMMIAARQLTTTVGLFAIVLTFAPLLGVALTCAAIPALFAAQVRSDAIHSLYDEETSDGRRAAYLDGLLRSNKAAQELKLFAFAPALLGWMHSYFERFLRRRASIERRAALRSTGVGFFAVATQFVALAWVAYLAAQGEVSIGDYVLLVTAISQVRMGLGTIMQILGEAHEHALFFQDYDDVFQLHPRILPPPRPVDVPDQIEKICCEGVVFTYPGSGRRIFDGLDLELRSGEITALVGHNGAGKSTLVKLLCRLYDPDAGRITVNGIDIRSFDPDAYRRRLSVLVQDFGKYELTAHENVALALEPPPDPRISASATAAGADAIVSGLPKAWETVLGRQFAKDGLELSQGQWQSIALARVLYRDSSVVILDEPTAAVDAELEAALVDRYTAIVQGRLSLLITHRFNTVHATDRIIVLASGAIAESGTHNELIDRDGIYAKLFEAQARHYRV